MFIRDKSEGSVYDYVPGHPLRLIRSAGDPKFSELRISDIDFSVFEYVNKTIDDKFVSEGFTVPNFKVGDRVRCRDMVKGGDLESIEGKIGVIIAISPFYHRVEVEGRPMAGGWCVLESELERVQ